MDDRINPKEPKSPGNYFKNINFENNSMKLYFLGTLRITLSQDVLDVLKARVEEINKIIDKFVVPSSVHVSFRNIP